MLKRILGFPLFAMIRLSEWIALKSWYHLGLIPPQTAVFPWLISAVLILLTGIDYSGLFYLSVLGFFIIVELLTDKPKELDGVAINDIWLVLERPVYFYFFATAHCILILFLPLLPDVFFGQLSVLILHVQVGGKGGTLWDRIKAPSSLKARLMPS